ncbi:hypothetical protein Fuma_04342 [Fuerstiella marisgermanici]|uniref:DUF1570 domain-containing protein n=2 Tax=Fuerstiella marisgermanici TaxID=1891926 RepID=A0A1P8WKY4_9PLAN|nr:hypothetical protein Fuma_04342 [Fuerstiella marisgermanici]
MWGVCLRKATVPLTAVAEIPLADFPGHLMRRSLNSSDRSKALPLVTPMAREAWYETVLNDLIAPDSLHDRITQTTTSSQTALRTLIRFAVVVCCCTAGCTNTTPKTFTVERPVRHTTTGDGYSIQSNFPIGRDAPLVGELNDLKAAIISKLELPKQRDPVVVYLFSDEESYRRYMHSMWPNLPPRRAYFVGTSRELAVYSFHSPNVQEDLRHEFTHGLLHASLNTVPLWLDEGLAEYFEVRGSEVGAPHAAHLKHLQAARANGWNPSMYQLEQLSDFQKMTQRDYAEAWGWVHFMLESDANGRQALIDYIAELETKTIAPSFMARLEQANPAYYNSMIAHVSNAAQGISLVSHEP